MNKKIIDFIADIVEMSDNDLRLLKMFASNELLNRRLKKKSVKNLSK